ncbi:MAG: type II secretion system protein [Candidatus Omnitrophota bacterium]
MDWSKKGFTLIELIMVIVVLGILAAVAIPRFFDLQNDANDAAEQGVIGGVRAGIATEHANTLAGGGTGYTATLDAAASAACSTANPCFGTVLDQGGITGGGWTKTGATAYTHTGTNTSTYTYTPANGSFLCTLNCP